jgi:hypothetical protein
MPARVNLNVPPRLIESARAAQYANREALGARTLADKIKAKAKARRDAALRAQPLPPDRAGEAPEGRDPLRWRIWRKRRPFRPVDVGVAWLDIGYNYTKSPGTGSSTDSGWLGGLPPEYVSTNNTFTRSTRIQTGNGTESASLEFVITVGTGSGETWKQVRHSLAFSGTYAFSSEWTYYLYEWEDGRRDILDKIRRAASNSSNFSARLWHALFPAGPSELILVVAIAQFSIDGSFYDDGMQSDDPRVSDSGNFTSSPGNLTVQNTKQISFLITQSSVTELTHAIPSFIQKKINSVLALPVYQWPEGNTDNPDIAISELLTSSTRVGTYQINFNSVSSAIYESIAPDGTFSAVSPQQAKTSYAAYSGNPEIPVLGYKRDDPSVASTPTTERGAFGIITGASVTAPVTPEMLAFGLEDELEQAPGASAANQPEPVRMVVSYDYHGGTYCRDRLELLGIDIP